MGDDPGWASAFVGWCDVTTVDVNDGWSARRLCDSLLRPVVRPCGQEIQSRLKGFNRLLLQRIKATG
jgi:hypothetical protein